MRTFNNNWDSFFAVEKEEKYFQDLEAFLEKEYQEKKVYPAKEDLFTIFQEVSGENVRVVLLGQDPYHQPGQAHGLSFSVLQGVGKPPSLQNIFKELSADIGCGIPESGSLLGWAREGVFLLNTCLTVLEGQPGSHRGKGWETLTDRVILHLAKDKKPKVFLLWGKDARAKRGIIEGEGQQHLILETVHPSPLSAYRGFFGCRHFSKTNSYLEKKGRSTIDWCNL